MRAAEAELTDAVAAARSKGHSWGELGRSIGITREVAQQRFSQTIGDLGGTHCDAAHQPPGRTCQVPVQPPAGAKSPPIAHHFG